MNGSQPINLNEALELALDSDFMIHGVMTAEDFGFYLDMMAEQLTTIFI